MKNNYDFWEEYLKKVKKEILKMCKEKEKIYIDLHIHSNYSSDGKQTIKQILESTKAKGFDIIAITDHDNLNVYDELYNYVKNELTDPIIIPGIEFTVDNKEYGNQCHMLQLFINPKDKTIQKNVLTNYEASFNRSKIQFRRLKENLTIKHIVKEKNINISYEKYKQFLLDNNLFPEYDTLCLYLIENFKKKNVTTFDILKLSEKYNELDCYEDRKLYKTKQYKRLREKYEENDLNKFNSRFLLSILAVREVDDDWWDKPSSGSLSVNSYGQLKIEEIDNKYNIFFAHPTEKSLGVVEELIKNNKKIIGLELNIRNKYLEINKFNKILDKYNLLKIIGSDSHDNSLQFYEDMSFYEISPKKLEKIIKEEYEKN